MSTTLAKPGQIERKWYILDAAGKPLGRVGDKAVLTGSKLDKKFYRTHSGWIGGLKEIKYRTLMAEKSDKAMMIAVKGMLPRNTLGAAALKRLRVYKGAEHNNAAQKPEVYAL